MTAELRPVVDRGAHPVAEERIEERVALGESEPAEQMPGGAIGAEQMPMAIDHDRWIGFVAPDHPLRRLADGEHLTGLEGPGTIGGDESRRLEQAVSIRPRHVEHLAQMQDHLPGRPRATRLEEGDVPRRDRRLDTQLELAHPAQRPPLPQQGSEPMIHPAQAYPASGVRR